MTETEAEKQGRTILGYEYRKPTGMIYVCYECMDTLAGLDPDWADPIYDDGFLGWDMAPTYCHYCGKVIDD